MEVSRCGHRGSCREVEQRLSGSLRGCGAFLLQLDGRKTPGGDDKNEEEDNDDDDGDDINSYAGG